MTFNDMEKSVYNLTLRENRIEILQRYTPKKKVWKRYVKIIVIIFCGWWDSREFLYYFMKLLSSKFTMSLNYSHRQDNWEITTYNNPLKACSVSPSPHPRNPGSLLALAGFGLGFEGQATAVFPHHCELQRNKRLPIIGTPVMPSRSTDLASGSLPIKRKNSNCSFLHHREIIKTKESKKGERSTSHLEENTMVI